MKPAICIIMSCTTLTVASGQTLTPEKATVFLTSNLIAKASNGFLGVQNNGWDSTYLSTPPKTAAINHCRLSIDMEYSSLSRSIQDGDSSDIAYVWKGDIDLAMLNGSAIKVGDSPFGEIWTGAQHTGTEYTTVVLKAKEKKAVLGYSFRHEKKNLNWIEFRFADKQAAKEIAAAFAVVISSCNAQAKHKANTEK